MLRRAVLALLLASAAVSAGLQAQGQGFSGNWEATTPNGGKITLLLRQDGRRVTGTLSGNGSRFEVEAEIGEDGGFYGTARAQAGALFIGGERSGDQLGVALAELTSAGVPDMRTAQELRMQRVAATADAAAPSAASGGKGTAGSAPAVGARAGTGSGNTGAGAGTSGSSPADQQLAQLLISSPWCNMRYSQQMGATTIERVVFTRDGRMVSRTQRESAVNNREGSYYGNSTDGSQGYWRVQNGALQLSADAQRYESTPLVVTRNSNGYPIITAAGKEYNQCN